MKMTTKSFFRIGCFCLLLLAGLSSAMAQDVAVFPQMLETPFSVAFSPDGKQVLSGSVGGTVKLWDVASGRLIRTFSGHTDMVMSVAFSPDGKQVLSGSWDNTVKLWDVASGRLIRTFSKHINYINSVAFSPDGKQVLSGSWDCTVKLWDVASGQELRTFSADTIVDSVAFSPDGRQVIFDSVDNTIKLWDAASGRLIRTFSGHTDNVVFVAFSPDGKQVLSGSRDNTIKLWDAASGQLIRTFSGHTDNVVSVDISPDGKQVLSGYLDYTVKLWDTASGRELRTFSGHKGFINCVKFSPDGKQVLSGLKLLDTVTGREIKTFSGHISWVNSVAFSPDGKHALLGLTLWDMTSGREIRTFMVQKGWFAYVAFSPDGKQVLANLSDKTLKLWDTESGRELRTFSGHTEQVNAVAFSPDGKWVLSGSGKNSDSTDNTVKLWDIASGREIRTFSGHTRYVQSVAFSPDGKQVLSCSDDDTIKLWDTASGREIKTFSDESVESAIFSPDGKQILSCSHAFTFEVLGKVTHYGDTALKLWDIASGRVIRTFSGHTGGNLSIAFSPDGKKILSGSEDNTIKLWNTASGKVIKTFKGHTFQVFSVAFNPNGKQILSCGDNTRLWDIASGNEIAQFLSFSGNDTNLAFATRGLTVETETAAATVEGEWLSITPDGYYASSPRGDRYLNVRVNNAVTGIDSYRSIFYNPDVVQARLQGMPDPASKAKVTIQQAAKFAPPTVTIQSPTNFSTTNTATTNLSVNITSPSQPIQNIKIIVNGSLLGKNDLSAVKGTNLQPQKASLTVTGNQKTVNFSLPINLNPGRNTIEVVAFNGYSESPRLPIEVTWNAPAGQKPVLPNLWILAVGVNNYQDSNINSLNYCVADAKGIIDSLKAQEGKRYAKVNSLLIADGEATAPTAENIRKNLQFLDQAGERDVVLLFLAGHGVSDNAGKFLFLPSDTRLNANKSVAEDTAITDGDIVKVLDRAGNLLVFIDACQSGGVDNDRLVRSLMETNAFVFTSSRGNELSQERKEFGHGVFTYSVMQGLKGTTQALAQGNVTVLSLSGFVTLDVPRITGGAQNPKAYSLGFYDFPMAVIK